MSSTLNKNSPIEGPSKRDLSKIQKCIKREENQKNAIGFKSAKRRAPSNNANQEPKPRKVAATQQAVNDALSEQKSISMISEPKVQASPKTSETLKKRIQTLKPFNLSFPVEGGQQGLFTYIMQYVYNKKQKQFQSQDHDTDFIDELEGAELEVVTKVIEPIKNSANLKTFESQKSKIKQPFDQNHKKFLEKIKLSS